MTPGPRAGREELSRRDVLRGFGVAAAGAALPAALPLSPADAASSATTLSSTGAADPSGTPTDTGSTSLGGSLVA